MRNSRKVGDFFWKKVKKGKRVTLAIKGVKFKATQVCILTCLLAELSSLKIQVKRLYLDREFFSISVIRWLYLLNDASNKKGETRRD